ncbi:hypothetical protein Acy02nite_36340 [Actinoplanes cyaneus]|uniref:Uncharacterized protein n=1 Tax=Actinoplanes cyaneus TaxID=52696 RepID=A0A919M5Z9_9ACTN|nr:hypothetical protein [Actinoplanes cyaneus]MCW2139224.1 hypothetical protein [Actinoplanes cyaneus]GID65753.1 hypothetical protein Acy02nite_36340 [Actinoplanes cyaneus]
MSLDVYPCRILPDGSFDMVDLPGFNSSAGGEGSRQWLYSSAAVRALGATYLPRLADRNLLVPPEETLAFLRECGLLLAHLPHLATAATALTSKTYDELEFLIESNLVTIIAVTHRARREEDWGVMIS